MKLSRPFCCICLAMIGCLMGMNVMALTAGPVQKQLELPHKLTLSVELVIRIRPCSQFCHLIAG